MTWGSDTPPAFVVRNRLSNVLEQGRVADFYQESDARLYIGEVSVRNSGLIDIPATAERLGIVVDYDPTLIKGSGLYVPRLACPMDSGVAQIKLNPQTEPSKQQHVFSHEVGHHFLEEVLFMRFAATAHNDISEVFCEVFGTEMEKPGAQPLEETEARAKQDYRIPADYIEHILSLDTGYYNPGYY